MACTRGVLAKFVTARVAGLASKTKSAETSVIIGEEAASAQKARTKMGEPAAKKSRTGSATTTVSEGAKADVMG